MSQVYTPVQIMASTIVSNIDNDGFQPYTPSIQSNRQAQAMQSAKSIFFLNELSALSGAPKDKLQSFGFVDHAENLIERGITPTIAAKWLHDCKLILADVLLEKDVDLIEKGFVITLYKDQDGVFLTKKLRAEQMPYLKSHVIDNDIMYDDTQVVTEIYPDRRVCTSAEEPDYLEEQENCLGDEGWPLVQDALG